MEGWIKLNRALMDHWLYSFDEPDKTLAWIDLLMLARHADGDIMLKGQVVKLKRGDVAISQLALRKRWKWSKNKISRYFGRLLDFGIIEVKTDHLTTVISICNYSKYQDAIVDDGLPYGPPDGPSTDHLTDHDIRMKEGKERKNNNTRVKDSAFILPDSVNQTAWGEFEQHRKSIKKPLTDLARKKASNILKALTPEHQQATIDKSIQSRWPGLYPDKVNGNEAHKRSNAITLDHESTDWLNRVDTTSW